VKGLVPGLVLFEVVETLRGKPNGKSSSHWEHALEGLVGPPPLPFSLFSHSSLEMNSLLHLSAMMCCLTGPKAAGPISHELKTPTKINLPYKSIFSGILL
jgi:hypothetical protein